MKTDEVVEETYKMLQINMATQPPWSSLKAKQVIVDISNFRAL